MFREASVEDRERVLRLYAQLHPDDTEASHEDLRDTYERILTADGMSLFVLEQGGAVVATTYLNVIPNLTRGASPYAVIENVVVEESLRGTGLGKQVMTKTLAAAWAAGCYKAMLLTGSKNESTHAFYKACGFSGDEKAGYLARPPS